MYRHTLEFDLYRTRLVNHIQPTTDESILIDIIVVICLGNFIET